MCSLHVNATVVPGSYPAWASPGTQSLLPGRGHAASQGVQQMAPQLNFLELLSRLAESGINRKGNFYKAF